MSIFYATACLPHFVIPFLNCYISHITHFSIFISYYQYHYLINMQVERHLYKTEIFHIIVEVGREAIWFNSLLMQEHPEQFAQHYILTSENLQGDPTTSLSSLCQRSAIFMVVFPSVQREPPVLWFVSIVSCPSTGHH